LAVVVLVPQELGLALMDQILYFLGLLQLILQSAVVEVEDMSLQVLSRCMVVLAEVHMAVFHHLNQGRVILVLVDLVHLVIMVVEAVVLEVQEQQQLVVMDYHTALLEHQLLMLVAVAVKVVVVDMLVEQVAVVQVVVQVEQQILVAAVVETITMVLEHLLAALAFVY
jgi:hypothetical protein